MARDLPPGLQPYRRTASFTEATVPAGLLADHSTKPGVWGHVRVEKGRLRYVITDPRRELCEQILTPDGGPGVIEPTVRHKVEPIGAVRFHVEFLRAADAAPSGKRAEAEEVGVDAGFVDLLVEAFYAKVRADKLLGPIFATRIGDWPAHLTRMKAFWRSVLHDSCEFSGNPMLKHLAIPGLKFEHFSRWLELFYETLREAEGQPAATELVGGRARMIADSLLTAITMRRDGLAGGRAGKDLPHA